MQATVENPNQRLTEIKSQITSSARVANTEICQVNLIAVSKTRSIREIEPLIKSGQLVFGENRIEEAAEKWPEMKARYPDIQLHLIGRLQSGKVGGVGLFDVIHTVDRPSLIKALGKAMRDLGRQIPCFIQVNIGEEPQKGGCAIDALPEMLELARKDNIDIIGLMCIPPVGVEPAPYFALLAELAARHGLPNLSMGMSGDFETAIMLGATHVRIGTALFGERG